jgi:hypothetical protein
MSITTRTQIELDAALFKRSHGTPKIFELMKKYLKGELMATSVQYGPLVADHAEASSEHLLALLAAGVVTDNGQQRLYTDDYQQRAYVCGTLLCPTQSYVCNFLDKMRESGLHFAVVSVGPDGHMEHIIHGEGLLLPNSIEENGSYFPISCTNNDLVFVTRTTDGNGFTNAFVDFDPFDIRLIAPDQYTLSFMVWESSWPELGEVPPEPLELVLLQAVHMCSCESV